ncbi:alpha/beta fold hydrolase [Skermania piniformis]|uniref:alpha/beta fold hydrolase n=1 Tax=Skermania pinensis TaxID=39122 RepID=UPI001FE88D14|nr:alpha/beta fold hydrolase [Skermania piniformis]
MVGQVQRLIATAQNGLEVIRFGGLATDDESSPFEVVERKPNFRLRHYFPGDDTPDRPVALLIPPLMVAADVYDVTTDKGAIGILSRAGIDTWVVDFGAPETEEGGWKRDLADHVVACNDAIDAVLRRTGGRPIHLAGYSQGGMFGYQVAAFRRTDGIASLITFGSPVDLVAGLPFGLPADFTSSVAEFIADHVVSRFSLSDSMVRTGFQLLDPVKTVRARVDFVRQLHDREALLPRERQRRFLEQDGWVGYAGPALADLLKQFVVHNRMVSGGFVIADQPVTLAEITCPILAFVGELDDIGVPAAVRGIKRAAPNADIYEMRLRAGHFGLVAGNTAATITWPLVADWVRWRDGVGSMPDMIEPMLEDDPDQHRPPTPVERMMHTAATAAEVGTTVSRGIIGFAGSRIRSSVEFSGEAARALPRLSRLGQLQPHTQISLGSMLAEQGRRAPLGQSFIFDDRVHTNAAVNTRIDNVVKGLIQAGVRPAGRVGVLMETRPSGLAAVAALSRLGAVSVLLAPGGDLAAAIRLTGISTLITDPQNVAAAATAGCKVLVLGGGDARGLSVPTGERVVDLEQIDPDLVDVPGWYRPNPGLARELAFILVAGSGDGMEAKYITNYRWALSAFGTASSADLDRGDTVYCLAPLHHSSGLLVSLGGAVAGGSRIALARSMEPAKFAEEVHRYGVTVVTYTWTMLREILDADVFGPQHQHPIRLFIGSGMPPGLWRRTVDQFTPARVLEFYAATEGDIVLANVAGVKAGCEGRPVPGTASVELAAYDPIADEFEVDNRGFVRRCADDEVGLLLSKASPVVDASKDGMRGVFAAGDAWLPTESLFRRDRDGDYWLVDNKHTVIDTARGPVFTQPIAGALNEISAVDLEVVYGLPAAEQRQVAVAAVSVRKGYRLEVQDLTDGMYGLVAAQRPDVVHVVDDIPVGASYRPSAAAVRAAGRPQPGPRAWYYDWRDGHYKELTVAMAKEIFGEPE